MSAVLCFVLRAMSLEFSNVGRRRYVGLWGLYPTKWKPTCKMQYW